MIRRAYYAAKKLIGLEVRPGDGERNRDWPRKSRAFLVGKACAACGGKKDLQVHHEFPFHAYPELEMIEEYWVVLCVSGPGSTNCHCLIGHCGDWSAWNKHVREDAEKLREMLAAKTTMRQIIPSDAAFFTGGDGNGPQARL
jgi:hypothetical protein